MTAAENAATVVLTWDVSTTPLEAIERTLYALADVLSGSISQTDGFWRLTGYPKRDEDLEDLAHRIRQDVTDQALRLRIAERTDAIRTAVFALAFSRSGLSTDS